MSVEMYALELQVLAAPRWVRQIAPHVYTIGSARRSEIAAFALQCITAERCRVRMLTDAITMLLGIIRA